MDCVANGFILAKIPGFSCFWKSLFEGYINMLRYSIIVIIASFTRFVAGTQDGRTLRGYKRRWKGFSPGALTLEELVKDGNIKIKIIWLLSCLLL